MSIDLVLALYSALLGAVIGSYLNVLIHRLPRAEPTVAERSRCPHCGAAIRPWYNVPILGYLALGGRCRDCRQPIHWRYPLVEGLTALLFLTAFRTWGASLATLAAAILIALSITLAAIDLEHFLLPDRLTLPGIACGLALQPWLPFATVVDALLGVALGIAIVVAAGGLWRLVYGVWGMGFGDAKLLAMIGAFLGWQGVAIAFVIGSGLGALVALSGIALGRLEWGSRLPFGAALAAGAIVALFAGQAPFLSAFGALRWLGSGSA